MVFLSLPVKIPIHQVWIVNLLDDWSRLETSLLPLTVDAILIVAFILVHSLLRSEIIKAIWQKLGLASASRCIYNLVTAAIILVRWKSAQHVQYLFSVKKTPDYFQVLVNKWQHVPSVTLWHFDTESSPTFYWLYYAVHAIAWIIIYGGSIVMDLPELTGVKQVRDIPKTVISIQFTTFWKWKCNSDAENTPAALHVSSMVAFHTHHTIVCSQVYYDWNNLLPPLNYKSRELVALYEHVRHPSFLGFSIILWLPNIMR